MSTQVVDTTATDGVEQSGIRYQPESGAPRVIGIVYLAPTRDGPDWARRGLGKSVYDRLVAEAQAMVAGGNGGRQIVYAEGLMPQTAPPGITHQWHQTAKSFLSEWGPDAVK